MRPQGRPGLVLPLIVAAGGMVLAACAPTTAVDDGMVTWDGGRQGEVVDDITLKVSGRDLLVANPRDERIAVDTTFLRHDTSPTLWVAGPAMSEPGIEYDEQPVEQDAAMLVQPGGQVAVAMHPDGHPDDAWCVAVYTLSGPAPLSWGRPDDPTGTVLDVNEVRDSEGDGDNEIRPMACTD